MTRARRNIYDGYCPICGKAGCNGSCAWPIPRLAAGPVPLPEGLADRAFETLKDFIHTYWGRVTEPLGDRSTRLVLPVQGTKVHGQPVHVVHILPTSQKVQSAHGPLLGAHTQFTGTIPEIVIEFNGSKTGVEIDEAMTRSTQGFRVQGWLFHELTHAFDKLPPGGGIVPWEDPAGYYNDPAEVRAYASQVWRYVMDNRDYYAASEDWIRKTGEKGLWELIDSGLSMYVGRQIRKFCTERARRYILQVAYRALQEAMRPSKAAADDTAKADLMRIRPILRAWTAGGWTDGPQLLKLLEKHKDTLAKFKPKSPLRLWRNERIEGPDGGPGSSTLNNHGWEDQYTRPTAWSANRRDAETYAAGKGRRLVTAIVPPEDMYVSVPMVDYVARRMGWRSFDPYAQSEVIVKPNPSFLDQLRPPVKYTREEEMKIRQQLVEQLRAYYAPQVKKLQEERPEGARGIAERAEEQVQGMVSAIDPEELPEKVKEWGALIGQWSKTASIALRASKTLYHGTTRDKAQEILKYGLAPDVGSLTTQAYGDEGVDLEPLTFAADREGLGGGVFSAMLHAISAEGHPVTDEIQAIRNWGAVVVIKEGEDAYRHRPGFGEPGADNDYEDYPIQVESGDYFSEDSVDADYAITGPALVRWLARNGVNLHQGYADPITRSERNRLIGWVHRVHPNIPMQEVIEKVTYLPAADFRKSWNYYKKAVTKAASMPTITTQEARDRGMFGPVFHGTTEDIFDKIQDEGFKLIEGQRGDEGVSNGYALGDYAGGIPAPAHHLGFGVYFTTVKSIAKYFAGGSTKTLKPYYLDVHNVETINFGSPNTMMKWWIANGYDPELAKKDRMAATKQLTETLRSKHDAVWFKGKGLHALLDKDQIVVFDPSKVYMLDDSKAEPGSLRSKVQRKSDGMVGVLMDKRPLPPGIYEKMMAARGDLPEDQRNSHWFAITPETKFTLTVKWQKGGTDYNVYDTEVVPYQGKRTRAAMALLGDVPPAPGTTPVKPGYVRLYHQTGEANLQSIEKTGLRLDHAKGIEGPRGIYAGEEPFYGDPESIPTLEFQVPKDKWRPPFVLQDVMPEDFIAAHYPWHRTVRYLESEPESLQAALAGQHDDLRGDEGKAIAYVKQKYGKTASAACVRAWITPGAQVKEFPAGWGHAGFAKRELGDDTLFDHQAVDMLLDKGWARMGTWDDLLYIDGPHMTSAQFNAIQSYVQSNPQWHCPQVDFYARGKGGNIDLQEFLAVNKMTDLLRMEKTASIPGFHSLLLKALPGLQQVADNKGEIGSPQAISWLQARQREGKFKKEELEASGLIETLQHHPEKHTLDQITAFVQERLPDVQSVVKTPQVTYVVRGTDGSVRRFKTYADAKTFFDAEQEWIDNESVIVWDNSDDEDDPRIRVYAMEDLVSEYLPYTNEDGTYDLDQWIRYNSHGSEEDDAVGDTEEALAMAEEEAEEVRDGWRGEMSHEVETEEADGEDDPESTRYDKYIEPGSHHGYEEHLIRHTNRGDRESYSSPHWDEEDVLAHTRLTIRSNDQGQKILFVEEIQSDWGQEGRQKGFKQKEFKQKIPTSIRRVVDEDKGFLGRWTVLDQDGAPIYDIGTGTRVTPEGIWSEEGAQATLDLLDPEEDPGVVPNAPFVSDTKSWVSLVLRYLINYAVEKGLPEVAFVNGTQSADRYDLSTQVGSVYYMEGDAGVGAGTLVAMPLGKTMETPNAKPALEKDDVAPKDLEDYIGKELAKRLLEQAPDAQGRRHLEGVDLKVGGEGMIQFYDKLLPQILQPIVKKLGSTLETIQVVLGRLAGESSPQLGFKVTPRMAQRVKTEGLPIMASRARKNADTEFSPPGDQDVTRVATVLPGVAAPLVDVPDSLFHGTNIPCAIDILRSNELLEGVHWGKINEPHGPRLTSNYDTARQFAETAYGGVALPGGVVLELDGPTLAEAHELVEYHDTMYEGGDFGEEDEVVAVAPTIAPLSRFLKAIHVIPIPDPLLQGVAETVAEVQENDPQQFIQGYRQLLKAPKVQKAARKSNPEADAETEKIRERSRTPEARKPHKFQPAKWTHPNGHPRCLICGDEETEGGMCPGLKDEK